MWSQGKNELHINVLKMKAVQLALNTFLTRIKGESVLLMSDNAMMVANLKKQGGTVSRHMQFSSRGHSVVSVAHSDYLININSAEEVCPSG